MKPSQKRERELEVKVAMLETQVAGLSAVLASAIACAPQRQRARVHNRALAAFEAVEANLLNAAGPTSEAALAGIQILRDAFAEEFARNP